MHIVPMTSDISQNNPNFQSKKCLTKAKDCYNKTKNFLNKEIVINVSKPQQRRVYELAESWKSQIDPNYTPSLKMRFKKIFGTLERLMQVKLHINLK